MMNCKQRYHLVFGGTELVEGSTGWYLVLFCPIIGTFGHFRTNICLGQYGAVLAGTWYLVLFRPTIGTFGHFRTNICLAGSYGALLVGWLLVVRTGCSYDRASTLLVIIEISKNHFILHNCNVAGTSCLLSQNQPYLSPPPGASCLLKSPT